MYDLSRQIAEACVEPRSDTVYRDQCRSKKLSIEAHRRLKVRQGCCLVSHYLQTHLCPDAAFLGMVESHDSTTISGNSSRSILSRSVIFSKLLEICLL